MPKPDTTWKDVQDALHKRWHFSTSDSKEIVENLQEFFDGSQDGEDWVEYPGDNILVSITNPESDRDGYDD